MTLSIGAALVLETAAAMPDRRKFSLNPSFALVLLVFAMVGYVVAGWWCWNVVVVAVMFDSSLDVSEV